MNNISGAKIPVPLFLFYSIDPVTVHTFQPVRADSQLSNGTEMLRWRGAWLKSSLLQYPCHATGELQLKMVTSEQEKKIKILLILCRRLLKEKTSKQKRKPGTDAGGQELSNQMLYLPFKNPVLHCRVPTELPSPNTVFSSLTPCTTTRKHKAIPKSCTHWPCLPDLLFCIYLQQTG